MKEHVGYELPEKEGAGDSVRDYREYLSEGLVAAGPKEDDGEEKDGYVDDNELLNGGFCAESAAERGLWGEWVTVNHT